MEQNLSGSKKFLEKIVSGTKIFTESFFVPLNQNFQQKILVIGIINSQ